MSRHTRPTASPAILAILIVTTLTIPCSALDQVTGMKVYNDSLSFEGYTLFTPLQSTDTYLIDNYGREIHSWSGDYRPSSSVYLLEDGSLLRSAKLPGLSGATGGVQRIDWDGTVVWEYTYANGDHVQHHDIEPLPNGNVLLLARENFSAAEAIAAGRDPSMLLGTVLSPEHIIEVEPTGPTSGEIVWEWHAWDHLVQEFDSTKANYSSVVAHPELLDINFPEGRRAADWLHGNAIEYNEELDQIVISSKPLSEIWVIDHSTTTAEAAGHVGGLYGRGGDFLYRWGNPEAYDAGDESDRTLYAQHDIQWIKPGLPGEGNLICYSNGNGRPEGEYSTIEEFVTTVDSDGFYAVLDSGEAHGPESSLWTYTADPPDSMLSLAISGVQRLPNGNTLICCGQPGWFMEVTPSDEIVWKYQNPVNMYGPTRQGNPDATIGVAVFRCARYAPDYPGLAGRDLTPGAPIEIYPITIATTVHAPEDPTSDDSIIVTTNVAADEGIASAHVMVDTGAGYAAIELYDDGLHGEGVAGDGQFGTVMGPFPAGTGAAYYLEITDSTAEVVTDPVFAPGNAVYRFDVAGSEWLCGDVDGSGVAADIADLIYLVNYMFQFGPEPPVMDATDVNGDGTGPDIGDLIYLVTYMFQQGDPPQCP